jgi:hypothetical protein
MLWCLLSSGHTPHPGVETDITMTTSVDTGGGSQIGGNVSAGRDFVGRDQLNLTLSNEAAEAMLPAAARRGDPDACLAALLVHPRYAGISPASACRQARGACRSCRRWPTIGIIPACTP